MITILATKSTLKGVNGQAIFDIVYFESPTLNNIQLKSLSDEILFLSPTLNNIKSKLVQDELLINSLVIDRVSTLTAPEELLSNSILIDRVSTSVATDALYMTTPLFESVRGYAGTNDSNVSGFTINPLNKKLVTNDSGVSAYIYGNAVVTFTNVTNANQSTDYTVTSTVNGVNANSSISIVNGLYSKNGGAFTSTSGTVSNGDSITLKITSASTSNTIASTTVTINDRDFIWSVTTIDTVGISDPNLLMLVNNGITDRSIYGNTATQVGTVNINSTNKRFNYNSFDFSSGTLKYNNTHFAVGTGDFTLDFWTYRYGNVGTSGFFSGGIIGGAYGVLFYTSGTSVQAAIGNNSTFTTIGNNTAIDYNTWAHWAVTRSSGICRFFHNGVLSGSAVTLNTNINSTYASIGARYANDNSYPLTNCLISNVRYLNYAAWTNNFSVPVADYY